MVKRSLFKNPDWVAKHREFIARATQGNRDAEEMLFAVADAARLLDDIVDGDKDIPARFLGCPLFETLLFRLEPNRFYQTHHSAIKPFITLAYIGWVRANAAEFSADERELRRAFYSRELISELVTLVAYLCSCGNGFSTIKALSHATSVSTEAAALYDAGETVEDYIKEHTKKKGGDE